MNALLQPLYGWLPVEQGVPAWVWMSVAMFFVGWLASSVVARWPRGRR